MNAKPTVFIVDDDQASRKSMRAVVRSMELNVCDYATADDFLREFKGSERGCLLTDLKLGGMSGIELLESLRRSGLEIPVILITAFAETPSTVRAVKSGALTVLDKPCSECELFAAVQSALRIDAETTRWASEQKSRCEKLASLTIGESLVLKFVMDGTPNKVIAKRLNVSMRTVEYRRKRIFEKTETESLPELVKLVLQVQQDRQLKW